MLEIGVGLGADHERFARAGAIPTGIDLTARAISNTRRRFALNELVSDLRVSDAEALPFADGSFDIVYSWGAIHRAPDTSAAAQEMAICSRALQGSRMKAEYWRLRAQRGRGR